MVTIIRIFILTIFFVEKQFQFQFQFHYSQDMIKSNLVECNSAHGIIDLIIDDLWIDISTTLNIKDFLSFHVSCHKCNIITSPTQARINKYWKLACIKLCGSLGNHIIKETKQWYPIFIELYKYSIQYFLINIRTIHNIPLNKLTNKVEKLTKNQWKNAILCQPSAISIDINLDVGSRISLQLTTQPTFPESEQEWEKIRTFWTHLNIILHNDFVTIFKIFIGFKPFSDNINSILFDARKECSKPFKHDNALALTWFNRVTLLKIICSEFDLMDCMNIWEYLLSLSIPRENGTDIPDENDNGNANANVGACNQLSLYFDKKPLFWTLVNTVCNALNVHRYKRGSSYWLYSLYTKGITSERYSQWRQFDHLGIGNKCIEIMIKKHLLVEGDEFDINCKDWEDSSSNMYSRMLPGIPKSGLNIAFDRCKAIIARLLIKYGATLNHDISNDEIQQRINSLISMNKNNGDIIQVWIDYKKLDINNYTVNDNGDTILVYAISKLDKHRSDVGQMGYIDTINYLLENNPTIDIMSQNYDSQGRSPFLQAIDKHCSWTVSDIYNHLITKFKKSSLLVEDGNSIIKRYINYYTKRSINNDEHCDDEKGNESSEKKQAESIYLYVCKQFPTKDEFLHLCRDYCRRDRLILAGIMGKLPQLIKILIDIKVDILVKDEKENKMGSDYICDVECFAAFKHFVQTQESIAIYFNNLGYTIIHLADNCITPTFALPIAIDNEESESIRWNTNVNDGHGNHQTVELVDSVTTLSTE